MASIFRRTLSLEDLVNGSEDEMEGLLTPQPSIPGTSISSAQPSSGSMKNGIRAGAIVAPVVDSPENDDFFLTGPQVPILNLDNTEGSEMDKNRNSTKLGQLPRSKSVRFEEPEEDDPLKKAKSQVNEVTGRMKSNLARLLDREANLGSLQDLSDQLQHSGDIYRQSSEHLRRKIWWRQQRTRLVLGAVFIIGVFLLIIPIITKLCQ